mmetsp:Transcript_40090/g.94181  ORF Transcript_40090/g.94181 Transcript_40090/m.94181 type:complete len:674 (-) Transcript_40090:185-2206(-)|eukprot:CAMPEP_0113310456 /NCGR_PEP_ID=MMETSP0010_2-20120614/8094_1 /TAXON_ID=216773 ORGANISM="Corethron hystrix, Strain 308" /NCGR_SAMPLE_ID=MMETSP0010_2 /ASSEMBLY_ACC=CAM_ASM_000155 /LENGTH=673 /DNA_ID=CAMNT_0000165915 /DNA_START=118 /DNA_END=2139 /DNA_ORIENTATION=- /assembly_acc=CAM_ASM_000155
MDSTLLKDLRLSILILLGLVTTSVCGFVVSPSTVVASVPRSSASIYLRSLSTRLAADRKDIAETASISAPIDSAPVDPAPIDELIADAFESSSPMDIGGIVGPENVIVYDTSLRDGTQGESVSISSTDKLKIASLLCSFGVDYIEAGWPGSNPKDKEFFERASTELPEVTRSKLVAFGSTRRRSVPASEDGQIQSLLDSGTPTVCIVAKGHAWQVTEILRATKDENLDMIRDSVGHICANGRRVFVDLEHFFDGYEHDSNYALDCCRAAVEAGARCLVLCDTNGGSMPWQIEQATSAVVDEFGGHFGVSVGVHTHNDCGMAVANSVVACRAGAGLVQGTVNGIGERTGNANLCTVVPSLALHVDSKMTCRPQLSRLTQLSRTVSEVMNRNPDTAAPFVGASAFAHKGGLHVAAMQRHKDSYQHIDPKLVGNEMRVLISELSGRQNILKKIRDAGFIQADDDHSWNDRAAAILNRVKQLESIGYTFEGADASVHLMVLHATKGYCSPFKVLDYNALVFDSDIDSASRVLKKAQQKKPPATSRATLKIRTVTTPEDKEYDGNGITYMDRLEVSDGSGPIDALSKCFLKALKPSHPYLSNVELTDYKVRILDPNTATGAATRVMIEFRDRHEDTSWSTVSVDRNVVSASLNALLDGYEYALIEQASECMLCDDFFD